MFRTTIQTEERQLPPIAGGAPTLAEALAELDADLKSLSAATEAPDEKVAPDPEPTTPAAATTDADAKAPALDQREQSLKALEESLTATATQVATAVKALTEHAGSRLVMPGASPDVAEHVAAGGTVELGTGLKLASPRIEVGQNRGVKALEDSKSVSRFFAGIKAVREGYATPEEREWLGHSKALAEQTGSAGGYLVPANWMPDILQLFRGVTVVRRARPGQIVPFTATMNQVSLTSGATAYYTPENAAIPTSQPGFGQATILTPKNLTGLVPASNYLLNDTRRTDVPNPINFDAEQAIRQELAVTMALKEDRAFLFGNPNTETGSPTGLINLANIVHDPIAPGGGLTPTLPQIRFIKNYVRRMNLPNARWTWFFHSDFLTYVEGLTDSLGRFLADAPNLLQVNDDDNAGTGIDPAAGGSLVGAGAGWTGRLLNIPFFASNQIPVNLGGPTNQTWLLLVDMNQLVIGLNQDLVIETSSEAAYTPDGGTTWISSFQNNQTLFKATMRHDINHRYPSLGIVEQTGVTVQ